MLSVDYAPPGSESTVVYGKTVTNGAGSSMSNSFNSSSSFSTSETVSASIPGIFNGSYTNRNTSKYTQINDTTESTTILKSTSKSTTIEGPSSQDGLNHAYDMVYIWLNPAINLVFDASGTLQEEGYTFDMTDPCDCMEVIRIPVYQLQDPRKITDSGKINSLKRAWAPALTNGESPTITPADMLDMAASDPYADPNYNPNMQVYPDGSVCSTDGRFCQSSSTPLQYSRGLSQTYDVSIQTTSSYAQTSTDIHTVSYGYQINVGEDFISHIAASISNQNSLTFTNKQTTSWSNMIGQQSQINIVGPTDSSYTGPDLFCVYQDNIYMTYMIYPCN